MQFGFECATCIHPRQVAIVNEEYGVQPEELAHARRVVEANAVFARIPWDRLEDLQEWAFFWPWDPQESLVRWMTSFTTTEDDVRTFAAGLRSILEGPSS